MDEGRSILSRRLLMLERFPEEEVKSVLVKELERVLSLIPDEIRERKLVLQALETRMRRESFRCIAGMYSHPQMKEFPEVVRVLKRFDIGFLKRMLRKETQRGNTQ